MILYSKFENEAKKQVIVSFTYSETELSKKGYSKRDVEPAKYGEWYIKGYVPSDKELTETEKKETYIRTLNRLLSNTDYIYNVIKEGDATEESYSVIIEKRKGWRQDIRELLA